MGEFQLEERSKARSIASFGGFRKHITKPPILENSEMFSFFMTFHWLVYLCCLHASCKLVGVRWCHLKLWNWKSKTVSIALPHLLHWNSKTLAQASAPKEVRSEWRSHHELAVDGCPPWRLQGEFYTLRNSCWSCYDMTSNISMEQTWTNHELVNPVNLNIKCQYTEYTQKCWACSLHRAHSEFNLRFWIQFHSEADFWPWWHCHQPTALSDGTN